MALFEIEQAFLDAMNGKPDKLRELTISPNFATRLEIYETSVFSTLQQALYKIYHAVEALIGTEMFQELTYRYVKENLAHEFNLNNYGQDLHEFVKTLPLINNLPYLPDFIEFCYLWQQIFLYPKLGVIKVISDYPLYEIWERCQPEFTGNQLIENWQGEFSYLVYRECDKVIVKKV
ncbi:MAG: putative DNA-binding domain-containing protein [Burkholderiales bacterium]|jgi:hypothetical protein|nr:putative DNA-binding domain-containing protein [Burkholderiales bacterium]